MKTLTRLLNADGEVVGWFSSDVALQAARAEWQFVDGKCRQVLTSIESCELEDVEPGDGDRVEYLHTTSIAYDALDDLIGQSVRQWVRRGAASVEVQRFLVNKYRRPGASSRDADLGGPADAAGVLYVLRVKAPK